MDYIDLPLRLLHIIAGAVSLLTGIAALLLSLKPKIHRAFGKVFFGAMLIVFVTAVILAITGSLQFLFVIAILSFFSTYHGIRSLRFFKGAIVRWYDFVAAALLGLSGIYLTIRGIYYGLSMGLQAIIILHLVFGGFMLLLAFTSINDLMKVPRFDHRWFKSHRGNMAGALIATITAFCTTALDFLPPLIAWLGPAVVFTPLFSYFIRKTNQPKKQSAR
jgi:hypothetical protein